MRVAVMTNITQYAGMGTALGPADAGHTVNKSAPFVRAF